MDQYFSRLAINVPTVVLIKEMRKEKGREWERKHQYLTKKLKERAAKLSQKARKLRRRREQEKNKNKIKNKKEKNNGKTIKQIDIPELLVIAEERR